MQNHSKRSPLILGLSCFYHDASAALLRGNEIVAAAQEERFTRKKFDSNFPENAAKYCLEKGGITTKELDCAAFYEDPLVKLDRIYETQTMFAPLKALSNTKRVWGWINKNFLIERAIEKGLPGFAGEVAFFHHHWSHASSAFYLSPFKKAAILTVDGIGEWSCASIGVGKGSEVRLLAEQRFPHSVGLLYSSFTQYIGFKVDSGEYKLMGLAPYGKPKFVDKIRDNLIEIHDDGSVKLATDFFEFMTGSRMTSPKFHALFEGEPRKPETEISQKEMDIASSIQSVIEEIIQKMAKRAVEKAGSRNLCMAGGVALNCVANGKILRSGIMDRLWIQPASGDGGGALGAAFLAAYHKYGLIREADGKNDFQKGSFLGPEFSNEEVRKTLGAYDFKYSVLDDSDWAPGVAKIVNDGSVVGLFQGRMEFGPRALGHRSIIGNPQNPEMQKRMNLKIKFRESFRPFAPMVLEEKASEWFEIKPDQTSPYMLLTTAVSENKCIPMSEKEKGLFGIEKLNVKRSEIPAVTHIDYSARVQTVSKTVNPKVHAMMSEFEKLSGCPVLINTSFNIRGEPIVFTPFDALKVFMNTEMDVLVLENCVLKKEDQSGQLVDTKFKENFALD